MTKHITVLQNEAVEILDIKPDSIIVDATFGGGGHALQICKHLGKNGVFIGIDADKTALKNRREELEETKPTIHLINDNFSNLKEILSSLNIKKVDGILADLGWRTDQFTDGNKGFSFQVDEPLLMTFGNHDDYLFTAYDIINGWQEEDIANVIFGYGEERHSRRIAKNIVQERKKAPIKTTFQLAEIVSKSVPKTKSSINQSTKTFQALRIAVNDELGRLEEFLSEASVFLAEKGTLAIITFHSLEDRIVKLRFKDMVRTENFILLNKKPITASTEELTENKRARSAKLRAIRKIEKNKNEQEYYK